METQKMKVNWTGAGLVVNAGRDNSDDEQPADY